MAELILPADAETEAIAYLAEKLGAEPGFESVEVAGSLPAETTDYEPGPETVTVAATGGTGRDIAVDVLQLTVTAWAEGPGDELRAYQMAAMVVAHLRAAERLGYLGSAPCSRVQVLNLPYKDPDPVTARARYSATCWVSLRGLVVRA
ncbi:tail terminator [Arthrobacter phage LittleTokyo]|nr:tail terminator [Arthrobacter phage LittleTokyo]